MTVKIAEVEHLKRFSPDHLDGRTKVILREGLIAWLGVAEPYDDAHAEVREALAKLAKSRE